MCTTPKTTLNRRSKRSGSIIVLSAVLMVIMFALVAFSVDMGLAYVNRAEMQRTADAAAIAAVSDLLDQQLMDPLGTQSEETAQNAATQFAALNRVGNAAPELASGDLEVGFMTDRSDPSTLTAGFGEYNAARVRVQRTASVNGESPFLFAPVFGHDGVSQQVHAIAGYVNSFRGFGIGSDGKNLGILPFALDIDTWNAMLAGNAPDDFTWDPITKTVTSGSDGFREMNLFPQNTGLPGNRGTVDIGHGGNSTADIKRQILYGASPDDLAHHGGVLELDSNGELVLNGDTGISAAVKAQLAEIQGQPRIIPIFDYVAGNGNNANFTIVKFVGVRIVEVQLTGKMSNKRVMVQPAGMRTLGGIPSGDSTPTTQYIFSPVSLVR